MTDGSKSSSTSMCVLVVESGLVSAQEFGCARLDQCDMWTDCVNHRDEVRTFGHVDADAKVRLFAFHGF